MAPHGDETPTARRSGHLSAWRWPITVGALGLVALGLGWSAVDRLLSTVDRAAQVPERVGSALADAARGMLTGDVTTRFISSLPEISSARGGNLELAVIARVETFERSDERRAFWDLVSLGRTTVGIRVPVVYRYHVPMSEPWLASIEGGELTVVAPRLRPSLPPSIRTDRMEKRVEEDWSRFDGAERLAELERELTPMLTARAMEARSLALARDSARRAVAEFAGAFLMHDGAVASSTVRWIRVRFADEQAPAPAIAFPTARD